MNRIGDKPAAWRRALQTGDKRTREPGYPATRLRRPRQADWSRRLVQEESLSASDLLWPIFICEGTDRCETVASMPGVERFSVDRAVKAAAEAAELGIPVMALFPYTDKA